MPVDLHTYTKLGAARTPQKRASRFSRVFVAVAYEQAQISATIEWKQTKTMYGYCMYDLVYAVYS